MADVGMTQYTVTYLDILTILMASTSNYRMFLHGVSKKPILSDLKQQLTPSKT